MRFQHNNTMIYIFFLCKLKCLTLPRTGDMGPESWCYFAVSWDFQSSSLAVNVLFAIYLFSHFQSDFQPNLRSPLCSEYSTHPPHKPSNHPPHHNPPHELSNHPLHHQLTHTMNPPTIPPPPTTHPMNHPKYMYSDRVTLWICLVGGCS